MWKASAATGMNINNMQTEDDDWETDPDFVNDVTEEEQRWGSKTIEGSGRSAGAIDMNQLRKETEESDAEKKKKRILEGDDNAAFGYGGKFGVQKDRMDSSAVGHDYAPKLEKHVSQKDYSAGFGGKYGVQTDRVDKSALSWDHKEQVEKHTSQKDYSTGFGGKFGVQTDRQDRSAVGWDHVEKVDKHESQKDYSRGFGGKFGVQSDRQDKSAVGWDHHEAPQMHESQTDHKKGFGGKFGVQTDRMDKSAVTFGDQPKAVGTAYNKTKPDIGGAKPSDLRAKFEKMAAEEKPRKPEEAAPSPKKLVQGKAFMFNNKPSDASGGDVTPFSLERGPKQKLDQSKTSIFSQQSNQPTPETPPASRESKPLDRSKMAMFNNQRQPARETNQVKQELEELKQMREKQQQEQQKQQEMEPEPEPELYDQVEYGNVEITRPETKQHDVQQQQDVVPALVAAASAPAPVVAAVEPPAGAAKAVKAENSQAEEPVLEDTGFTAVALYDYQAAADDEVSFDPDDIITHVEMIDEGWWRGLCKGQYGLFPANYVQLQQ